MRYGAFMRGINVGTAKRVPMADLRKLSEALGYTNVSTLLNSGNLLFDAPATSPAKLAASLHAEILMQCGVACAVTVISAKTLKAIVEHNPLKEVACDPSRYLVAFCDGDESLELAKTLSASVKPPDQVSVGDHAVYLWCDAGVLDSPLSKAFSKLMGKRVTARNWSTLEKICAAL